MRVVIVTGIFPPDIGGPATHASDLRDALLERGHQVVVLTLGEAADVTREPGLVRWPRSWPWPRRHAAVVRWIVANRGRIDAIYATGMHPAAVAGARLAGLPSVVKIVGDPVWERGRRQGLTEAEFEAFQRARGAGLRVRLMAGLRDATLRSATAIVTPSEYLAHTVEGWLHGPADVEVIPNGVAVPPLADPSPTDGRLSVIYVGRLVSHKRVERLIGAVARTDDVHLSVIGSGPAGAPLAALVGSLGVREQVTFLGDRAHDEVLGRIAGADALVLASDYEGLPHVVVEALAVGTPVISPPVGGVPEVIIDGRNGLLIADATEQRIAEALARLRDDGGLLRCLSDGAARDGAAWRFGSTADGIEAVLGRARAGRPKLVIVGKSLLDPDSADLHEKLRRMQAHADVALVQSGSARIGAIGRATVVAFPDERPKVVSSPVFYVAAPLVAVILAAGRRPAAVVCRSPYEGVIATVAARPLPRPMRPAVIVEVHGDWRTASRSYGSRLRATMSRVADRLAVGAILRADRVRVIGAYTESLVRATGYRGPVDAFATFRDFTPFLEPLLANTGDPLVAFLGGSAPVKGLDVLLQAWPAVASSVPGARLEVAGPGMTPDVEDDLGVMRRGTLDVEAVRDLLDRASVVVMPSRSEGMGRLALEAHGRARPVVASAVGGLPEVVEDGETGVLVPPDDPDSLAQAIVTLLEDPERARAMGRLGRERMQARSPSDEFERGIERLASWVSR
jgi:glycosyltransferase involved in cell wall biosynthesis